MTSILTFFLLLNRTSQQSILRKLSAYLSDIAFAL